MSPHLSSIGPNVQRHMPYFARSKRGREGVRKGGGRTREGKRARQRDGDRDSTRMRERERKKKETKAGGHSTIIDDEIKESTLQGSSPSLCQARARSGRARPPGGDHDFTAALSPFRRLRRDPGPHRPAARAPSPGRRRRGRRRGLCPRPPVIAPNKVLYLPPPRRRVGPSSRARWFFGAAHCLWR